MRKRSFFHMLALLALACLLAAPGAADDYAALDNVAGPSASQAPLEVVGDCEPYWTWIAGVEATYLRPEFLGDNNVAVANDVSFDSSDFDHDYGAAPRVWIGLENPNGWGLRARYWDFTSAAAVNEIEFGDFFLTSVDGVSQVEAYTIDLEVTKRLCTPTWMFLGGFGARHAHIRHDEQLTVWDSSNLYCRMPPSAANLTERV